MISKPAFICPSCRDPVERRHETYSCDNCGRSYPILFGIPDFRLGPDPYLSLEEERSKAAKLELFGRTATFAALVEYYYSITDDVQPHLVPVFSGYIDGAPTRAANVLNSLTRAGQNETMLDLGCGSGGGLIAGIDRFGAVTGVDIALRWLVIAKKRLDECGASAQLICADAQALPFPPESFSLIIADDLVDNIRSTDVLMRETAAVLSPGGRMWFSASNSRWIGPHPATGIWAAGLIPEKLRKLRDKHRYGYDPLRAVSLHSLNVLRRASLRAGLVTQAVRPRHVDLAAMNGRSAFVRALAFVYGGLSRAPGLKRILVAIGPAFEIGLIKPVNNPGVAQ